MEIGSNGTLNFYIIRVGATKACEQSLEPSQRMKLTAWRYLFTLKGSFYLSRYRSSRLSNIQDLKSELVHLLARNKDNHVT